MKIKTPEFWKEKGFLPDLLVPISLLYFLGIRIKNLFSCKAKKLDIPVICVGNITAGGAGKTPTAIALAKLLKKRIVSVARRLQISTGTKPTVKLLFSKD